MDPVRIAWCVLATLAICGTASGASAFSFQDVRERARELAGKEYREEPYELPPAFSRLGYAEYSSIRFRPAKALWRERGLPFTVELFHPGFLYDRPVRIHVVQPGNQVRDIPFDPARFVYPDERLRKAASEKLEYAGFRVLYPLNDPDRRDEFLVFLGASYFRMLAAEQVYGVSARGLAIDTASPNGEEFPRFTDFWLHQTERDVRALLVHALLDSPSLTGAYAFHIEPGTKTTVDVEASLFPRKRLGKLGLAPLTSMFLYGENRSRYFADFRQEVHDSDGLLFRDGENGWWWRPLWNPTGTHRITRHPVTDPPGFGLLQRDRDARNYQDLEQRYETRPSVWVEPIGDWGKGALELVEIPTHHDSNDNVVAYWVPKEAPAPGEELKLRYRLTAYGEDPSRPPLARTLATRVDPEGKGHVQFVVDFAGPWLPELPSDTPVSARVKATPGTVSDVRVRQNPVTGGWRLRFVLAEGPERPVHLEANLRVRDRVVSETWTYQWEQP